jgi:K+-sensing histidine kinase KdpD
MALAFAGRWLSDRWLGEPAAFVVFALAVLVIAWGSGAIPALMALAVSIFLTDYFFLQPRQSLGLKTLDQWWLVLGYVLCSLVGIMVVQSLHRGADLLQRQKAEMEEEIARRRRAEAELNVARHELRDYALDLENSVRVRTSELNEAVGFLENFCYSIAHDLRAPARAVNGFARLLAEGGRLSDEDAAHVQRIRNASTRMDALITGLLEFGRLSHTTLSMREIDLRSAIDGALQPFQRTLQRIGARIVVDESLHTVWSDWGLLQVILRELIKNAIEFRRPDETLRLTLYSGARDNIVRLWVCDNGVGISPEYSKKIFGLFQTLGSPDLHHVGLGLAMVSKAAERLHGAAGVHPGEVGGCSFWVDLPRFNWALPSHPRPESELKHGSAGAEPAHIGWAQPPGA